MSEDNTKAETQADIAAALRHLGWESVEDLHYWAKGSDLDRFDQLVQAFARHRLAALSTPQRQEYDGEAVREALEMLIQQAGWARHYEMVEGSPYWYTLGNALNKARAALAHPAQATPSAVSGDAGEDGDEFNRGVLIAVSTLINCWGAGTETEHLLAMINADEAMVERMGFDDYDREPLLAALPPHQGAGE